MKQLHSRYDSAYYGRFLRGNWPKQALLKRLVDSRQPILHLLKDHFSKGSLLLDYGCGSGNFLAQVMDGFAVTGIDVSETAVAMAAMAAPRARVLQGSQEMLMKWTNQSLDIITCFDVLEHVDQPVVYLQEFHRLLKPSGWLVVSMPVLGSVAHKRKADYWVGYEDKTHRHLWGRAQWRDLLHENRFSILAIKTAGIINSPTSPYALTGSLRILQLLTQPLGMMGVPLPSRLSDEDYFICTKSD